MMKKLRTHKLQGMYQASTSTSTRTSYVYWYHREHVPDKIVTSSSDVIGPLRIINIHSSSRKPVASVWGGRNTRSQGLVFLSCSSRKGGFFLLSGCY